MNVLNVLYLFYIKSRILNSYEVNRTTLYTKKTFLLLSFFMIFVMYQKERDYEQYYKFKQQEFMLSASAEWAEYISTTSVRDQVRRYRSLSGYLYVNNGW